jgi:hypothetical protein
MSNQIYKEINGFKQIKKEVNRDFKHHSLHVLIRTYMTCLQVYYVLELEITHKYMMFKLAYLLYIGNKKGLYYNP